MASPRPHLEPPVVEATVPRWRVRLLGATEAIANDGTRIDRFGGASVSGLLARLALFPGRSHPREELIDRLWPDASIEVGRNRLRQALFALRALLEPPGAVARPVLIADRDAIRVAEGALGCDVGEFERALREGRHHDAQVLYAGELMPGSAKMSPEGVMKRISQPFLFTLGRMRLPVMSSMSSHRKSIMSL